MPSPFPGMDPYVENQEWEDFHSTFNTVIREGLSPRLDPRYIVRVERRVYVEHVQEGIDRVMWSDVAVLASDTAGGRAAATGPAAAAVVAPVEYVLPMPEERRETYLVIRERETTEVITVIETLSPANKRPGGDGRRQYLEKRESVLASRTHLVELDLLRGGLRLPTVTALLAGDYYAVLSRRRSRAEVYAWSMRHSLPTIPIPLKEADADVPLDLQTAFTTVYDRARFHMSLKYQQALVPPLNDTDAVWVRQLLETQSRSP